ncbi:MAG: hypothetical protein Rhirs2KO_01710 [Rhizobiaceae bacterium]
MSKNSHRTSWFESLRREGSLFAALAVLLVLLNALQPLGAAHAAGQDFVICTLAGATDGSDGEPGGMPENCPACIGFHQCSGIGAPKDLLTSEPAFAPPAAHAANLVFAEVRSFPSGGIAGPPPAIRAPPFVV